jgi:hypothetical protein
MNRPHIWAHDRDVCIACGRTAQQIIEQQLGCGGTPKYREWLKGMRFIREPVVPKCEEA